MPQEDTRRAVGERSVTAISTVTKRVSEQRLTRTCWATQSDPHVSRSMDGQLSHLALSLGPPRPRSGEPRLNVRRGHAVPHTSTPGCARAAVLRESSASRWVDRTYADASRSYASHRLPPG